MKQLPVSEGLINKLKIQASPLMHFIIGRIIGQEWVTNSRAPLGAGLSITSDGFVQCEGLFFGGVGSFEENLKGYTAVCELTPDQKTEFETMVALRVQDWRTLGQNGGVRFVLDLGRGEK